MDTILQGLSGARILIGPDGVSKRGPRCYDQGVWIVHHQTLPLPQVFTLYPDGYQMEELTPVNSSVHLDTVVARLECFWSCAAVDSSPWRLSHKITELVTRYRTFLGQKRSRDLFTRTVHVLDGRVGLTHGDPTFENFMMRKDVLILCDPLPSNGVIPNLVNVDLGKLLQSALGWETKVRGTTGPPWTVEDVLGLGSRRAIIGWGLIHLLRTFPYLKDHDVTIGLIDAALGL